MKKALLLVSLLVVLTGVTTSCSSGNNGSVQDTPTIAAPTATPIDPLSIKKPQSDYSIVVNRSNVLGTFNKNNTWTNAADSQKIIKGDEVFTFYSFDSVLGTGIKPKYKADKTLDITQDFPYSNKDELSARVFIYQLGISGPWNALPRKPEAATGNLINYGKMVKEVLDKNALPDSNISIKKSAVIDLDGDGTKEQIVSAYDYNTANWFSSGGKDGKGTYSMVVLNKTVDGKEQNIVVRDQYTKNKPAKEYIYFAPLFLDVDNDGNMEIVVEGKSLTSSTIEFYRVEGSKVRNIYSTEIPNNDTKK
ncbi:MAG: hypothetical protein Q8942_05605 [Bacillota bacterium]|nr:hypothetical protein [Bacillota bacterium]